MGVDPTELESNEPDVIKDGPELEPNPLTILPEDEPVVDVADGALDEGDAGGLNPEKTSSPGDDQNIGHAVEEDG
jgi:hypothetical protein